MMQKVLLGCDKVLFGYYSGNQGATQVWQCVTQVCQSATLMWLDASATWVRQGVTRV